MTEQQLAAMRQALSVIKNSQDYKMGRASTVEAAEDLSTAIEQAKRQQALDKKAENARELGLDYEPVQEPFVWLEDDKGNRYEMPEANKGPLLKRAEEAFESAKQREWVGLTEQERNDIEDLSEMMIGKPAFDAIEAKLKERNT